MDLLMRSLGLESAEDLIPRVHETCRQLVGAAGAQLRCHLFKALGQPPNANDDRQRGELAA